MDNLTARARQSAPSGPWRLAGLLSPLRSRAARRHLLGAVCATKLDLAMTWSNRASILGLDPRSRRTACGRSSAALGDVLFTGRGIWTKTDQLMSIAVTRTRRWSPRAPPESLAPARKPVRRYSPDSTRGLASPPTERSSLIVLAVPSRVVCRAGRRGGEQTDITPRSRRASSSPSPALDRGLNQAEICQHRH